MKEFVFYQDEKVTTWLRHTLHVKADSEQEAEDFIRKNRLADSTDWHGQDFGGRVEIVDANKEIDPSESVSVEDNGGWPTIEIQAPDKRHVADNCGNRNYKAENGLWRDEAIQYLKDMLDAPDEKIVEFVDKHWESTAPNADNLFRFDLWQHGGDPARRRGKRELWAFTYHFEMGEDATDGQIVAAYESADNDDQKWPVEKMSPEGFANLVNAEMFPDTELFVRFIWL